MYKFVAGSYGAQQKVLVSMEKEVVAFGQEERCRLAPKMEPKAITIVEDETFHPEICLVGMEPISNFILLEKYATQRDAKTWTDVVRESLSDLSVRVFQVVSDEAKGLLRHTCTELGVHYSPDLFHGLHEIGKGVFPALSSLTKRTQQAYDKAVQETKRHATSCYNLKNESHHGSGNPSSLAGRVQLAQRQEDDAKKAVEAAGILEGACVESHPGDKRCVPPI
ncbi:MAG: hypothetical protein H7833_12510 [Magnetococcus sp. DMHC-1]